MTHSGVEELRALAGIINSAVESIVGDHRNYPSMMNVPPSSTINHALMAAKQLIATLDPQYSVVTAFTVCFVLRSVDFRFC